MLTGKEQKASKDRQEVPKKARKRALAGD